jgi:hypothetical protein
MKVKQVTLQQLAQDTKKVLARAQREPVVVRAGKGKALVIRAVVLQSAALDATAQPARASR